MNKNTFRAAALLVAAILVVGAVTATFVVSQTQYALVLRLGSVRGAVSTPGLHFKVPFIDNVVYFDKRVLDLDLPLQTILSTDRQNLEVDAFVRFQIVDPLRFLQGATNMERARYLLTGFANSSMRHILASSTRDAIVRTNRANLMRQIQEQMKEEAVSIGVRIVDMRLTRVDLPATNSQAVFDRMVSERQREAADIRAQGDQAAQIIRAKAQREATVIVAEANRQSQSLRGQGDGEKNRILAEAFKKDPEFFTFIRSMQAYEAGLVEDKTNFVLSPTSDFFRYFRDPTGKRPDQASPGAAAAPSAAKPAAPAQQP